MQPFDLFLSFYSPVVWYGPPTLDAVVAYCLERQANPYMAMYLGIWRDRTAIGISRLPEFLAHAEGIPLASSLQLIGPALQYMDSWKKRFDTRHARLCDFGKARRRIDTASGQYRSHNMPLPAHAVREAVWRFIGDGEAILTLITDHLWAVGKKTGEGFGVIDRMVLAPAEHAENDILAQRPVPFEIAERRGITGGVRALAAWRAPYWARENVAECRVPE